MQDYKLLYCRMDKDVRDALWQWIIDHSSISQVAGKYSVKFMLENEDDLWRRVYYRYTGQYERYNKEEKASLKNIATHNHIKNEVNRFGEVIGEIDRSNNLYYKFILFLYRKTKRIINAKK